MIRTYDLQIRSLNQDPNKDTQEDQSPQEQTETEEESVLLVCPDMGCSGRSVVAEAREIPWLKTAVR